MRLVFYSLYLFKINILFYYFLWYTIPILKGESHYAIQSTFATSTLCYE